MREIACVNGQFGAPEDSYVPIDDRGFVFGDGVYETMRSYGGRIWALERHWNRLEQSLSEVQIVCPLGDVRQWTEEAMRQAALPDALVYVQITRGVAPRQHTFEYAMTPTVVITVRPARPVTPEQRAGGVSGITYPDLRWARRDIKSINLLPNILAKQEASRRGAFEAILVDEHDLVTEGSSTNVMAVLDGILRTAPADNRILGGVTRQMVLELARDARIRVVEEPASLRDLDRATELMVTGTTAEVLGVTTLDGRPIGSGCVGPITRRLYELFHECIIAERDCPGEKGR